MSDWKNLVETVAEDIRSKYLGFGWTVTTKTHLAAADIRCERTHGSPDVFVDMTRLLNDLESHGLHLRFTLEGQTLVFRIKRPGPQSLQKWASNLVNWSTTLFASLLVGGAIVWIAGTHPSLTTQ